MPLGFYGDVDDDRLAPKYFPGQNLGFWPIVFVLVQERALAKASLACIEGYHGYTYRGEGGGDTGRYMLVQTCILQ